jgi:hypothetical protein
MNDAYQAIAEALRQANIKYAFIVLDGNQIIEMGNLNQRAQAMDRIGSENCPQS